MSTIYLADKTKLSNFGKPYIVAEINTSHFGNTEMAKMMISRAKEVGCDCVKFQSWSADTLYSKTFFDENPIAKRMFDKLALSEESLIELSEYSRAIGIAFASTPYSKREVDILLAKCHPPYIKVASMDLNNYPFLEYIAESGAPIVLSTGMGTMDEIKKAVQTIEKKGNQNICILHCTSVYPAEASTLQLRNIVGLQAEFPNYPIGYSDHTLGTEIAGAAVAMGACMIEKHFTLDRKKIGMDNQMATEPEEMATLIKNCRNIQISLGSTQRVVYPVEAEQKMKMRRSLVVTRDLKAGAMLCLDDLDAKRPGTSLPPEKINEVIGKTLNKNIQANTLLTMDDIT